MVATASPGLQMSQWLEADFHRAFEAEHTDAMRLYTAEDGWVERYGVDVLISHKTDVALERMSTELYLWTLNVGYSFRRIFARLLPKQNSQRLPPRLVLGDTTANLQTIASERLIKYGIDFSSGYSVGLFIDQRENRQFVRDAAPKRLLNCFAYTCSFAVAAATAGAETVNIDLSRKSLNRGRENLALNALPTAGHRFIADDVMSVVPRLARKGEKFDIVILDPPTFSRTPRGKAFQVESDFETLLLAAIEVVEREGFILLSTNCSSLDERALEVMARFCLKATRRAATFHRQPALPDFPHGCGASTVWMKMR